MKRQRQLIGPWRKAVQAVITLVYLGLPFCSSHGKRLFNIDIPHRVLFFFGARIVPAEIYLLGLLIMAAILLLFLVTVTLGRIWCGWCCPQSVLNDLAEWWGRIIGMKVHAGRISGSRLQQATLHLFHLLLALVFGSAFVWYFLPPAVFLDRLFTGELGLWPMGTAMTVATFLFIDLTVLRRVFCSEFCPYGRIQTVLIDRHTLIPAMPEKESARCGNCLACVRACPVGIDIRAGFQIECINCARCLDACRRAMAKRNEPGIIRYAAFSPNDSPVNIFSIRAGVAAGLFFLSIAIFIAAAFNRPDVTMTITRLPGASQRLMADGKRAAFYTLFLSNRDSRARTAFLSWSSDRAGVAVTLPVTRILLTPTAKQRMSMLVTTEPGSTAGGAVTLSAAAPDGTIMARRTIEIIAAKGEQKK